MIEWSIAKWMLAAGLAMLALCACVGLGRTMRRAVKTLAATRRQVAAALVALTVVCVGVAQKPDRGENGDDGRVERVARVEVRGEGSGMRDDGRVERVERVEETQTPKHSNTQTLSPADIARGWRVESVTTNATFGYQGEYTNLVEKAQWSIRGGRDMRFKLDFDGFVFPLGSNEITRVCVLSGGTIWTMPPIRLRETICAAQAWQGWYSDRYVPFVKRPVTFSVGEPTDGGGDAGRTFTMSVTPSDLGGDFGWTHSCGTLSQRFSLTADGTFSIRKYKYEASRTINGVPTYREVGQ